MNTKLIIFILTFSVSTLSHALIDKVIYGEDDRLEPFDPAISSIQQEMAKLSVAKISIFNLDETGPTVKILEKSLSKQMKMCPGEAFETQTSSASCSGFFIPPDMVVTAGHCISDFNCQSNMDKWIFNYEINKNGKLKEINHSDVYKCKYIINKKFSSYPELVDFALIKLDRPVDNKWHPKEKISLRNKGSKIPEETKLTLVGNPMGIPKKITVNGNILNNKPKPYFLTDFDSYKGNSGSMVFDDHTGQIEGILVRGTKDLNKIKVKLKKPKWYKKNKKCKVSRVVTNISKEKGEGVTRINIIPELYYTNLDKKFIKLFHENKTEEALDLFRKETIDINTRNLDNGKTALIYAIEKMDSKLIDRILKLNPSINLSDYEKNYPLFIALFNNNLKLFIRFIELGADLNVVGAKNKNLIRHAIDRQDVDLMKLIVRQGAIPRKGFTSWLFDDSDYKYLRQLKRQARKKSDKASVKIYKRLRKIMKKSQ
ncbi:MAG: trypsin-like serine protease [Bdellovibrionales bacterium]|jgi:V8-like Glu-specific endopeptidase|nr:trypsin-like serine protease [Bdellovibrionales bacterium]